MFDKDIRKSIGLVCISIVLSALLFSALQRIDLKPNSSDIIRTGTDSK
jgi:hypothetical protein